MNYRCLKCGSAVDISTCSIGELENGMKYCQCKDCVDKPFVNRSDETTEKQPEYDTDMDLLDIFKLDDETQIITNARQIKMACENACYYGWEIGSPSDLPYCEDSLTIRGNLV